MRQHYTQKALWTLFWTLGTRVIKKRVNPHLPHRGYKKPKTFSDPVRGISREKNQSAFAKLSKQESLTIVAENVKREIQNKCNFQTLLPSTPIPLNDRGNGKRADGKARYVFNSGFIFVEPGKILTCVVSSW